ncbi:unnamed protein product [Sphagnum tenellum]
MSCSPSQRSPQSPFSDLERNPLQQSFSPRACAIFILCVLWIPENGTRYFRSAKIRSAAILAPENHGKGCELQRFLNEIDCMKVVPEEEKRCRW